MTEQLKILSKKEFIKKHRKLPNQEEVWDEISDLWAGFKKKPFFNVEDFLKGKKGKIIDLGCGSGRNMIPSKDIIYYGVDFSENQIKAAKENTKENKINAKFFKMSGDKLDPEIFNDSMFDYGLFIATLHCIEGEEKREKALFEFFRVLKPGAEGLISVWNSEDSRFSGLLGDIYMSWKKDGKDYFRYYYLFSRKELISLLKKVGFNIIKINSEDEFNDRFSKKNWIIYVKKT